VIQLTIAPRTPGAGVWPAWVGSGVVEVLDRDRRSMMAAIHEFGDRAAGAETVLFYYAGHGLQVSDTNYILPVSVALVKKQDL
jgi:uncharacterized caspase-like protein